MRTLPAESAGYFASAYLIDWLVKLTYPLVAFGLTIVDGGWRRTVSLSQWNEPTGSDY